MEPLDKAFVVVPVAEQRKPRQGLVRESNEFVRASNEFVRMVPYAFSWPRIALYCFLVVVSFGTLLALSVWFPQVFTRLARQRLPHSSLGRAHYVLILVHEDGLRSLWVEVKLQHPLKPVGPGFLARQLRRCRRSGSKDSAIDKVAAVGKSGASSTVKQLWVWFEFKKHRYAFDADKGEFERYLATTNESLSAVTDRISKGLSATSDAQPSDVERRRGLFGKNVVGIDEPSVALLLFSKIMHPFYLFQIFSVAVWFVELYTVYAIVILVLSAFSLLWETYCEVANTWRLRKLVHSEHRVTVVRDGAETAIDERDLVPGDIVIVAAGPVCADMLLLSGMCEADEASITGEALPVAKTPASGHGHTTSAHHKSSVLYTGSRITRVHEGTDACKDCDGCKSNGKCARTEVYRAVVLRTGFSTGKGELFRSILYPRPLTFEFERDSYRYLFVLVAIALAAFIKRLVDAADVNTTFGQTALHSLDLITIAVPPALPLVLSSGINFALGRLRLHGVACMDVRRINLCGQLTCFCFDKTGTLTGEHFKFAGVDGVVHAEGSTGRLQFVKRQTNDLPAQLRAAMTTCHDLSVDGQGLMLDMEVFAQTQCRLALSKPANTIHATSSKGDDAEFPGYETLKRFPFDSSLQRSSVITRNLVTLELVVFVKGSPDAIRGLKGDCPDDFVDVTRRHAAEGHYCIAFASKTVREGEALDFESRAAVESGLKLLALVYFTNELKPESTGVVAKLKAAELDVRMITGDDPYTALQVAKLLKMELRTSVAVVDVNEKTGDAQLWSVEAAKSEASAGKWEHFTGASISRLLNAYDVAITGPALEKLRKECEDETIVHLVRNTRVYARIQPQQKAWIVEQLMDMGHIVGMCGDGTNDCGALKAAHVGLALLSGVEASLVASFTSKHMSIEDVPVLIREGRCAIMTSFLGFKFMVLYPLIQLAMAATLAHFDLVLSNNQYVWDDMAIVLGLSISMLATGASTELTATRPPRTLFAPTIAGSIAGQVGIFIAFFAGHFALLKNQPTSWFCRIQDAMAYLSGDRSVPSSCAIYLAYNTVDNEYSFEGTSVWLFGHMLYISVAAAFNVNDPFRLPFYRNWLFTALLLAVAGVNLWFLLDTSGVVDSTFQLMPMPFAYRWKLLTMFLGHFGASVLWELVATRGLPRVERPAWVQRLSAKYGLQ